MRSSLLLSCSHSGSAHDYLNFSLWGSFCYLCSDLSFGDLPELFSLSYVDSLLSGFITVSYSRIQNFKKCFRRGSVTWKHFPNCLEITGNNDSWLASLPRKMRIRGLAWLTESSLKAVSYSIFFYSTKCPGTVLRHLYLLTHSIHITFLQIPILQMKELGLREDE